MRYEIELQEGGRHDAHLTVSEHANKEPINSVLRIRNYYPGSRYFSILDAGSNKNKKE
jgi:hypothetical protein